MNKKLITIFGFLPLICMAEELPAHKVVKKGFGFMDHEKFMSFLPDSVETVVVEGVSSAAGQSMFDGKSAIAVLFLTFIGGIALNLTPCVLPMIPINLSIIGASQNNSKRHGILRAGVYSFGMVVACGITGVIAVLGGASLGGLAATWYFNLIAAIVFLILGISMFDLINLDLSRFQTTLKTPSSAKLIGIFLLGGMTAVLAGACVAPVVIAIMIYAAGLYASGVMWGFFLPFLLGLGMALPWPLLAAGISLLPKPGGWMIHVKHVFGLLIILIGLYYGIQAWKIFSPDKSSADQSKLYTALIESKKSGKPVFVDFYADWCKNCIAMDKTTFQEPRVKEKLQGYEFVKIDATNTSDPEIKKLLNRYGIKGLPAFLILKAE
ncbi:MAG: thioredoxin family protein [Lentisphaeria bacterium]|nr:thioredoxin family protein [Lentisphaeria bacterium]